MATTIPKTSTALSALLRADFTTQWRNRRSVVLVLLVPVIILVSWKGLIEKMGGPFALSNSLTYGLIAIGLMGYTNSIARDRDKGVFQRLRVAPVPTWAIMMSRLFVQLMMIVLVTTAIFVVGYDYDKITLTPIGYVLTYFTATIGGAVYLALGQMIVGMIKSPETVNSTSRLVYFSFIIVGMFGGMGLLGKQVEDITQWSPYGTVKTIMAAGMAPGTWTMTDTNALLVTITYIVVFATIGIKKFKWESK
jgi:ABC-2 type transport system permease protein